MTISKETYQENRLKHLILLDILLADSHVLDIVLVTKRTKRLSESRELTTSSFKMTATRATRVCVTSISDQNMQPCAPSNARLDILYYNMPTFCIVNTTSTTCDSLAEYWYR